MIWRCTKKCPENNDPCEFSDYEMGEMIEKSTSCPIREDDCFELMDETNEFYCLIVGSRGFNDYNKLCEVVDKVLSQKQDKHIVIVAGGAEGADALAEQYARERNYQLVVMMADWEKDGKAAGFLRNERMHKFISEKEDRGVIAFWDGESKGTAHSFSLAKRYSNQIRLCKVEKQKEKKHE